MPILTFTSDFGSSDHLVGTVKGEILKLNESFNLIDITHDIIPYNFMQAAYVCKGIFESFPQDTFHLILVNAFDKNSVNSNSQRNFNSGSFSATPTSTSTISTFTASFTILNI